MQAMRHYHENTTFLNLYEKIGLEKLMQVAGVQETKSEKATTLTITPKANRTLSKAQINFKK